MAVTSPISDAVTEHVTPTFARAAVVTPNISTTPVITEKDRDGVIGLSNAQWEHVVRLLNAGKGKSTDFVKDNSFILNWILDTGASHHMTGKLSVLTDIRKMPPVLVILADGTQRLARQEGSVFLSSKLVLKSVFYVEGLETDLISVGQLLVENRCVIQLADTYLVIQDRLTRMVTGVGSRENGTFYFRGMESIAAVTTREDHTLWHNRLGHPSDHVLSQISSITPSSSTKSCATCFQAKQTKNSFPVSTNKAAGIFDLIHCDVWGPYRTPSSSGARYFLTIVDDCSRGVWIFLMHQKSETQTRLKEFFAMVERQFEKKVKIIRSDNGTEFMCLGSYFRDRGMIHETSCVGTPNQNGRAERKHRHILNVARALMFHASLPIQFWGECVLTARYLINRTPSSILQGKTPYEILYQQSPSMDHLRVFGSLCFAHNLNTNGDKFASRTRRCIFIGYPYGQKGWRLIDLDKNQFFVSRDVRFEENFFPFSNKLRESTLGEKVMSPPSHPHYEVHDESLQSNGPYHVQPNITIQSNNEDSSQTSSPQVASSEDQSISADTIFNDPPPNPIIPSPNESVEPHVDIGSPQILPADDENLGRGHRQRKPSSKLKDYVTNTVSVIDLQDSLESNSLYPIGDYLSSTRFSASHKAFQIAISTASEPKTYAEAAKVENWRQAMQDELSAQEANQTWELTELPPGKKAIGSHWVYRFKYRSDGILERYKARLVALGNRQLEGVDYGETFAPVAKMSSVRLFLKYAAVHGWPVHQMDVHNAFLHGDLKEEVYMRLPQGYHTSGSNLVCRLRKSIYGLKQSPRCWFEKLSTALRNYGFLQSSSDYSLFTLDNSRYSIRILIYVDDLIIMGSCESEVSNFKDYLSTQFHMKDLGLLKYFLGIEVARNADGFYLCQRKYALDILQETGLLGAKPAIVPLPTNHGLALSTSPELSDATSYRRLVGKLIYLANTRPDLSYAVHTLAQFMQQPRVDHWDAAIRVVRYLKGSPGQGILLHAESDLTLTGWCDADWATCPLSRRSLTGYFVQLGSSIISWKTKKQSTVSRSSAEAEYRSMAYLTQELIWLKRLLQDMGFMHTKPMQIYSDSKAAIDMTRNPVFHERTKHVGIDCHFIRDEIAAHNVVTQHVPSIAQLADILTKPLGQRELQAHNGKLGIVNLLAPT